MVVVVVHVVILLLRQMFDEAESISNVTNMRVVFHLFRGIFGGFPCDDGVLLLMS